MNAKKLLSLWGLKWNPFSSELPSEGLLVTAKIENFAWRVEQLVQEGGFALITGEPGTGKSVALRILAGRLDRAGHHLALVVADVVRLHVGQDDDPHRPLDELLAEAVRDAVTDKTRAVYTESLSNPTLRVADVPRLAAIAHDAGVPLVVDNTFSPLILSPVDHGADIVVHSITKFISGMSDVIAGAVCGTKEFIESLMDLHEGPLMLLGPTMDPRVAANISLRIPHLPLRRTARRRSASRKSR